MTRAAPDAWASPGFSFLSGLPEQERRRRKLMPVQVFADESGGQGHSGHFVMASLMADAESWLAFSQEWSVCLQQTPAIRYFKMTEAVGLNGEFHRWSESARNDKLRSLARVINRYVNFYIHSIIDLSAFNDVWKKLRLVGSRDPYFWPFQNTMLAAGYILLDYGLRERFEMIFDEHVIFGPRAKVWYPVLREMIRIKDPELYPILPVDPLFRSDDEFLPLQASDLFAWCAREQADGGENSFDWLLAELRNVRRTEYSQYYDAERMKSVVRMSYEMLQENNIPQEFIKLYQETHKKIFGKRLW